MNVTLIAIASNTETTLTSHHLAGDGFWKRTHAIVGHAMIGGKHDDTHVINVRRERRLTAGELHSQRFNPAKRAARLGLRVDRGNGGVKER